MKSIRFLLIVLPFLSFGQAGTVGSPYTSLGQAWHVPSSGIYHFDIGGTTFSTYVEVGSGWVLAISGNGSTSESSYPITTTLTLQSDEMLNSSIYTSGLVTAVRINSTSGAATIDAESTNATVLSNLQSDLTLSTGTNSGNWTGTGTSYLSRSCAGNSGSLSLYIYHACGNGTGMHWQPTSGNEQVNLSLANNDLNLWIRATAVDIVYSPGGVQSNLALWLKADGDVYNAGTTQATDGQTIDQWSGEGVTTINANQDVGTGGPNDGKPIFKNTTAQNINYHPVVYFNGTKRFRLSTSALTPGAANNAFYVVKSTTSGTIFVQEHGGAVMPKVNSDGSMTISKNVSWEVFPGGGDGGGTPTLNSFTQTSGNVIKTYFAGKQFSSTTMSANPRSTLAGTNFIGERATCCNSPLSGYIAEIIGYTQTTLSGTDKNQIDSYLALKYAITLDNSGGGTAGDYQASDESIIWDASDNSLYQNAIVAIGRDDNSGLLQNQSHTNDDTIRVYLSTLASDNASNAGSFSSDRQYVIIGGSSDQLTNNGSSEFPSGQSIFSRIEREWKISNTAFTGTFSMDITLDSPGSVTASDLRILIDTDGDLSDATMYNPTISYAAGIITLTGISTTEIPTGSTRYMTIVSVNSATPLPVELASFDATLHNNEVELTWQTMTEINNDHFTIERSSNTTSWEILATVDGAGNSSELNNYRSTDRMPLMGTSYYRLKQTDYDGQFTYSKIRTVDMESIDVSTITIYPNPADNLITLEGNNSSLDAIEFGEISVYDLYGRNSTSLIEKRDCPYGKVVLDISRLGSGIYLIKTKNAVTRLVVK